VEVGRIELPSCLVPQKGHSQGCVCIYRRTDNLTRMFYYGQNIQKHLEDKMRLSVSWLPPPQVKSGY